VIPVNGSGNPPENPHIPRDRHKQKANAISGEISGNESGVTGMELVNLISGMILAASLLILLMNPGDPAALFRTFHGGWLLTARTSPAGISSR